MKKILFAILAISVICFAASTEKCNPGTTQENTDVVSFLWDGVVLRVLYVV